MAAGAISTALWTYGKIRYGAALHISPRRRSFNGFLMRVALQESSMHEDMVRSSTSKTTHILESTRGNWGDASSLHDSNEAAVQPNSMCVSDPWYPWLRPCTRGATAFWLVEGRKLSASCSLAQGGK